MYTLIYLIYIGASLVAQRVKSLPAMWETQVRSLGREDPLEKEMATHSSILAWRIPVDRGAWWATAHQVTKSQTRLREFTSTFYAAAAAKSLQSCPTLCDPRDGSPPGSSVPGILQARTLEWVDISFSSQDLQAPSNVVGAKYSVSSVVPVTSKWFPLFILVSSVYKSLKCLISTLTQEGEGGHLYKHIYTYMNICVNAC